MQDLTAADRIAQDYRAEEELVNYYRTTDQFTDLDAPEELTPWQSGDGVACQVAHLTGYMDVPGKDGVLGHSTGR